jgi:hypothetical protein
VLPPRFGGGHGRRVTLLAVRECDAHHVLDACKVADHALLVFAGDEMPQSTEDGGGDLVMALLRAQGLPSLYTAAQVLH